MFKIFTLSLLFTIITLADGPVFQTGQTLSYDAYGNIVTDNSIKDDGYYQAGIAHDYDFTQLPLFIDIATGLQWENNTVEKQWLTEANYEAGNYFDTSGDTATTYCNDLTTDGGGWRLPTIWELLTLVDFTHYNPSVIPGIDASGFYYTSTIYVGDGVYHKDRQVWGVSLSSGGTGSTEKYYYEYYNIRYVRCVRGAQLDPKNLSRSDNIVSDSTTGLQWQDDIGIRDGEKTWKEAIDYCENTLTLGGYTDWRLPNINEIGSLLDYDYYYPPFNMSYYGSRVWSSTTDIQDTSMAWYASNIDGNTNAIAKNQPNGHARCVRGGKIIPLINPALIMYLLN